MTSIMKRGSILLQASSKSSEVLGHLKKLFHFHKKILQLLTENIQTTIENALIWNTFIECQIPNEENLVRI
jgi:hypothetical protein